MPHDYKPPKRGSGIATHIGNFPICDTDMIASEWGVSRLIVHRTLDRWNVRMEPLDGDRFLVNVIDLMLATIQHTTTGITDRETAEAYYFFWTDHFQAETKAAIYGMIKGGKKAFTKYRAKIKGNGYSRVKAAAAKKPRRKPLPDEPSLAEALDQYAESNRDDAALGEESPGECPGLLQPSPSGDRPLP